MHPSLIRHLNLLITIVDRDHGQIAVDLLLRENVLFHRIVLGRGTAKTEMLNLLGIGETQKDIIFSVLPEERTRRAMRRLRNTLQFDNPGHGVAFTVPISSVGGQKTLRHLSGILETEPTCMNDISQKEKKMETKQYDLVISIMDFGNADDVMSAARQAGARGGTVLHARGAGIEEAERFFGITIQPEKEMLLILCHHEEKKAIMEAICRSETNIAGHGVVFSVPAFDVVGVARMLREEIDEDD